MSNQIPRPDQAPAVVQPGGVSYRYLVVGTPAAVEQWRRDFRLPDLAVVAATSASSLHGISGRFLLLALPSLDQMAAGELVAITDYIDYLRACRLITLVEEGEA